MLVRPKPAKPAGIAVNIAKSLAQTSVLWVIFLFAIPLIIRWIENLTILSTLRFEPGFLKQLSVFVFVTCALLGFWSGFVLVKFGNGTPFPFAHTHSFVVAGLYRHIRNPMTLLGITQGIAVGVYLGSWLTIAYAFFGAISWNYIARPWEERDLAQRFGKRYERYQQNVPCWRIKFKPYEE